MTAVTRPHKLIGPGGTTRDDAQKSGVNAEVANLKLRVRALNATNTNLKRRIKELETQLERK